MKNKTAISFPQPEELKLTGDVYENWKAFKLRFELYIHAVSVENDERKLALLLMLAGRGALDVYKTFDLKSEEKHKYAAVMARFDQHFSPRRTEAFQRYIFRHRLQKESESIEQFVMDLRLKSQFCNFGSQCDAMIRDQLVFGIQDDRTRMLLLKEPELTLLKAIRICQASQRSKLPLQTICIEDESLDVEADPAESHLSCDSKRNPLSQFQDRTDCSTQAGRGHTEEEPEETDALTSVGDGKSSEGCIDDVDEDCKEISFELDSAAVTYLNRHNRKAEANHGHMMDPPENMNPLGVFHSCGGGKQPVCVCRDSQGRVIQLDVAPSCSATAPDKVTSKQQQDKPYVKKPPNAFVIFMRENRAKIKDFAQPKHSAEANAILGQMWKTMSPQDQEKYYQKAAEERRLHAEQHPDWSSKDNYGKKRKRQRSRAQTK
ncbi:uncharacterized protein LOC128758688 [Synchiropus splendidus]|uniref:uncharacterized protein LOC128758688 n=1 Tax=Synchiropus splendidus TaxID=270530 RepID=UPI00237E5936|nr:uncharacterized protein LOC128758688 [Synchiropus splendidus]